MPQIQTLWTPLDYIFPREKLKNKKEISLNWKSKEI